MRFGTPKAVCGQRTALTPPPGFGHVRGRLGPMHGEQVRRPFPHLVTPPMAQAFPTLSPAAALLAASPHMVTRGSLPATGLRTPFAVPCQPVSMSTPSLNPFPDAASLNASGTPRTPLTPVFRSRSYTPTPLLMRQSVIPAAVTVAPPVAELVARQAGSVAGCSSCASARGPSPEPVAVGRRSPVVSPPKLLPPGRSPSRPCGRIVPSLSASKEEVATPAPGSADAPPAVKWAAGTEVSVAGLRIRCKALLGRGSFSEVWSGEVMGSNTELALKDIICKSQADLDQALLEASLLERFQPLATGQVPVMRIPRYYGHRVDSCREGWRICLAMARMPGESLDSWLRKRGNKQQQDGPSSVRRGCALAIALLRQLGPTLSRISCHVWHRDVNSHNILISAAEGSSVEDEEISNRVSFWLIDFGLAVEAQSWPQKWHNTDVAGDCRYWAPSSFVMSFCGPEETAASPDFCSQYKTKLDIVGLGLTALELLCSTALASKETWGPDGLRGSWERLLDTWERYREDVTRWHSMIFQVFTKGGDIGPLYRQLGQERVVERVISHIAELRGCLLACVKRAEDPSIQRLLTVLAESIDEKSSYDMRQVLEHLDPEPVIKVAQMPVDHSGKLQWSPPETLWSQLRRPFMGGA